MAVYYFKPSVVRSKEPPSFTIGVEEENMLIDRQTRDLATERPRELIEQCKAGMPGQIKREFPRAMIELGTTICTSVQQATDQIKMLRRYVIDQTAHYNITPMAASTHPFAEWQVQRHSDKERYHLLEKSYKTTLKRQIVCSQHVHVGIEDDETRIELFNKVRCFLPYLLALSASSPFWRSRDTGLSSYRTDIRSSLLRTGVPQVFENYGAFKDYETTLLSSGAILQSKEIKWDVRPHETYKTLELRIPDSCPLIEDGACITALYVCLLRMLYRLGDACDEFVTYPKMLIDENRWQSQRYGLEAMFIDFKNNKLIDFNTYQEELLDRLMPDAEEMGCVDEILHARTILERGNSADRQRCLYEGAIEQGATHAEALVMVVDHVSAETAANLHPTKPESFDPPFPRRIDWLLEA